MAQNWHKNSALVRACSGFTWRVSDCEELVGVTQTSKNHPLNSLKPLSKRILLNEFESSEGQNKILLFGKIV
jgi:hypothetical protein